MIIVSGWGASFDKTLQFIIVVSQFSTKLEMTALHLGLAQAPAQFCCTAVHKHYIEPIPCYAGIQPFPD